jgi:hypothetical protein
MGIGYELVFGVPVLRWFGALTFLAFLAVLGVGFLVMKGKATMKQHKTVAIAAVVIAVVHAALVLGVV